MLGAHGADRVRSARAGALVVVSGAGRALPLSISTDGKFDHVRAREALARWPALAAEHTLIAIAGLRFSLRLIGISPGITVGDAKAARLRRIQRVCSGRAGRTGGWVLASHRRQGGQRCREYQSFDCTVHVAQQEQTGCLKGGRGSAGVVFWPDTHGRYNDSDVAIASVRSIQSEPARRARPFIEPMSSAAEPAHGTTRYRWPVRLRVAATAFLRGSPAGAAHRARGPLAGGGNSHGRGRTRGT